MSKQLYPEIEPYQHGLLQSPDSLHHIYYEQCGNPTGVPVVVLHGGPGSGCNPNQRRFFDPAYYRIILFDQRGSGRSRPLGYIEHNTIQHLLTDMEQLRSHLGISKWLVFGGSWGSTLALSYTTTHKSQVSGLILRGIFLAQPHEVQWFMYAVRNFFPEEWNRFTEILSPDERQDILAAYAKMIFDGDDQQQTIAARAWSAFESSIMTLRPANASLSNYDAAMIGRLRVHLHYLINDCFLRKTPLLPLIDTIRDIPTTIIHGRYDMVCPVQTAYALHTAWPEAEFEIIADAGHAATEPGIASALVAATERFKSIAQH